MKAVVLCGRGKVEYREVEKPQIGERDLLIEVKACGICGSDLHFFYGGMEPIGEVPLVMDMNLQESLLKKEKKLRITGKLEIVSYRIIPEEHVEDVRAVQGGILLPANRDRLWE